MSDMNTLTEDEQKTLASACRKMGMDKAAKASGASELALAKAAAGIGCQKGTIALARQWLSNDCAV